MQKVLWLVKQIKVRGVKIGQIDHIRLSDKQNSVIARAQIDKHYDDLLTDDAKIWVVKPRIDDTGISGMSTTLWCVFSAPGESKSWPKDLSYKMNRL